MTSDWMTPWPGVDFKQRCLHVHVHVLLTLESEPADIMMVLTATTATRKLR